MNYLSEREFDKLATEVWRNLLPLIPQELAIHFDKIQILVEDAPSPELLADLDEELAEDPEAICGLNVGIPLTEQSLTFPSPFPSQVYLFRRAIQDLADYDGSRASERRLREEIAVTLLHEIGHFFGLSEADLERLNFG